MKDIPQIDGIRFVDMNNKLILEQIKYLETYIACVETDDGNLLAPDVVSNFVSILHSQIQRKGGAMSVVSNFQIFLSMITRTHSFNIEMFKMYQEYTKCYPEESINIITFISNRIKNIKKNTKSISWYGEEVNNDHYIVKSNIITEIKDTVLDYFCGPLDKLKVEKPIISDEVPLDLPEYNFFRCIICGKLNYFKFRSNLKLLSCYNSNCFFVYVNYMIEKSNDILNLLPHDLLFLDVNEESLSRIFRNQLNLY